MESITMRAGSINASIRMSVRVVTILPALLLGEPLITVAGEPAPGVVAGEPAPGVDCVTGSPAPVSAYSIPVANLPAGSFAANSLSPNFLNPAGSIFTNTHWGVSAPTKYMTASNYSYLAAKSRYCSRDMEVETWSRNGIVFLRLTPDGNALYFFHNGETNNGYLEIGVVKGFTEGVGVRYTTNNAGGDYSRLWVTRDLQRVAPGYAQSMTNGQKFTFGVSGFDIYAKLNGIEFIRIKDYRHLKSGAAAEQAFDGYGFKDITVRNFQNASLFSNPDANLIDLRDFGLKSISTTGSIAQGSNQLILHTDAGFQAGDDVVVAVGGENDGGLYGTTGVGGAWPGKSYSSLAAMQADTGQPDGTAASLPSGDVYKSWSGTWTTDTRYYYAKISPRSLDATVTAVSRDGKTLTLDKQSVVSTTNAKVYHDNTAIVNRIGEDVDVFAPTGLTLYFPAGDFAISNYLNVEGHTGWTIAGAGQSQTHIFSPAGAVSAHIWIHSSPSTIVRDLHLEGNVGDNGYGLTLPGTAQGGASNYFTTGVDFYGSNNSVARDLKLTNLWWKAVGSTYSDNVWAYHVQAFVTAPIRTYVQWQYQWTDSTNGGCIDCIVTSAYLTGGFNSFKSSNIHWIRPVGINATMAMNSIGNFLIQDAKLTVRSMSQFSEDSFSHRNPMININSNIAPDSELMQLGGIILNARLLHEGYINNTGNDILSGIVVNAKNPNITVRGGSYQAPNYKAPSDLPGAVGVNSTGAKTLVDGFRVTGSVNTSRYPGVNIALDGATSTLRNCVADKWRVKAGGAVVNCKTNAH